MFEKGWLLEELEFVEKDLEIERIIEIARRSDDSLVCAALFGLIQAIKLQHPDEFMEDAR